MEIPSKYASEQEVAKYKARKWAKDVNLLQMTDEELFNGKNLLLSKMTEDGLNMVNQEADILINAVMLARLFESRFKANLYK